MALIYVTRTAEDDQILINTNHIVAAIPIVNTHGVRQTSISFIGGVKFLVKESLVSLYSSQERKV